MYRDLDESCGRPATYELVASIGALPICSECAHHAEQAIRDGSLRVGGELGVPVTLRSLEPPRVWIGDTEISAYVHGVEIHASY